MQRQCNPKKTVYRPCVRSRAGRRHAGQAMVEFIVVMGILLSTLAILTLFVNAHRDHTNRVMRLVASEYP